MGVFRMLKKYILAITLVFFVVSFTEALGRDDFLGTWELQDNSRSIKIIKEGELYYIIEFVHLKHELYFSGDGKEALFIEWGKGPGWDTTMLYLNGDIITEMYFSEEYEWQASEYVYYRKP
jgi:hypothetical protein